MWHPGNERPPKVGMYDAQDFNMGCNCCWMTLHWDGEDWHSDLLSGAGNYRTLHFQSQLKRWREPTGAGHGQG